MSLAVAQSAQAATTSITATSLAVTWSNNTGTGNLIVVCFSGGTNHVTSVTDSQSNTYVVADAGHFSWSACEIWYAKSITGGTTPTVTVNFSAQPGVVQVYEVSGADQQSPLNVHTNASGDGVTSNQPTVTTSATSTAYEILFVVGADYLGAGTDVFSANAGWSNFLGTNSTPTVGITVSSGAALQIVTSNTYVAALTMASPGTTWEVTAASFKALPSSNTVHPIQVRAAGMSSGVASN